MPHASFRQDTVRTLPYVGRGGKHQCIYWEASFECFGVRVFPSGRRTYVYSYRVRGRKRLGKIGRVDVLTLDQARKKAKACLGKVAEREDPQQQADAEKGIPTVEQLADAYIKEYAKPKKKTWEDDQSTLTRNLLPAHRAALATTITSAEISAIHVRIGAKHPYTANSFLDVVRKMYNWAKKPAKLIPKDHENPVAGITRFPQYKRRRFLTTVEMPRFIRALEEEHSDYARHAIWMLLLTGAAWRRNCDPKRTGGALVRKSSLRCPIKRRRANCIRRRPWHESATAGGYMNRITHPLSLGALTIMLMICLSMSMLARSAVAGSDLAPEFTRSSSAPWINSPPLTLVQLRGKVG